MILGWKRFTPLVFFALSLPGAGAHALEEVTYDQKLSDFTPPATGKCSLTRFSMTSYDHGYNSSARDYVQRTRGTMVGTVVETSDPSCIRDYAVVQFIRGCVYDIEHNEKTGEFQRYFGTVIDDANGNSVPFKFDRWQVDTVDPDPMYYSVKAKSIRDPKRFNGQFYAKRPLVLDGTLDGFAADQVTFFNSKYQGVVGNLKAHPKRMHSLDFPSASNWYGYHSGRNVIQNTSLEFKTCLYKTAQVSLKGSPKSFDVPTARGGPLHCFSWESRNEFDLVTKTFIPKKAIDPFCSSPLPPDWLRKVKKRTIRH